MTSLLSALQWRYATKKFDPTKKLSDQQLTTLLESLRLSASSYGLQPWKFLVITDPAVRAELRKDAWDQSQVTDASHLIVLCGKNAVTEQDVERYIADIVQTRGIPADAVADYRTMMLSSIKRHTPESMRTWVDKQVYIALGTLLTAAALEQIDTCPMEGFDGERFDATLDLSSQGLHSVVLCPVGFRAMDDHHATVAKVRFPLEQMTEIR